MIDTDKSAEAEFQELSRIAIALMCERDRKALLRMIVVQGKRLTHSDGGGLVLVKTDETRPSVAASRSVPVRFHS
jgi:hypothetical protein